MRERDGTVRMRRVRMTLPDGSAVAMDTPDPALIGPWLLAQADVWLGWEGPGPVFPFRITVEVA